MEVRDLRYALAALDAGSYARAAQGLFVTRQALSQGVRRLSEEVGFELFEVEDKNRLVVTPEGSVLLAQARPVVEALDELARAYPSVRDARGGTLTLALATGVALSLPTDFFDAFGARMAGVVQEIEESNTESALALLDSGRADVALVGSCPALLEGTAHELARLRATGLWLAVPPSSLLAGRATLALADLDGQRLVTAGKLNHLHRFITRACQDAGVRLEVPASSSNVEMLVRLAREHDALCFAFPWREGTAGGGRRADGGVTLAELVFPGSREFGTYAVRRRDSRRTLAARRFWAYACERGE